MRRRRESCGVRSRGKEFASSLGHFQVWDSGVRARVTYYASPYRAGRDFVGQVATGDDQLCVKHHSDSTGHRCLHPTDDSETQDVCFLELNNRVLFRAFQELYFGPIISVFDLLGLIYQRTSTLRLPQPERVILTHLGLPQDGQRTSPLHPASSISA